MLHKSHWTVCLVLLALLSACSVPTACMPFALTPTPSATETTPPVTATHEPTAVLTATVSPSATPTPLPPASSNNTNQSDLHKIQHIVVVMQENRSFDHYFGTYPGADGIPMKNGVPTVCVPDPATKQCVKPFHDPNDLNHGGPHGAKSLA